MEFDKLWDYTDPVATREKFYDIKNDLSKNRDPEVYYQLITQIARTHGLVREFERSHQILDQISAEIDKYPVAHIRYLLERGRTLNSSGKPKKALPLFQKAWKMAKTNQEYFHAVDAAHMIAIAVEDTDERLKWNLKAIYFSEESGDDKAIGWLGSLYNNTGWSYHDAGEFEKALELFEKAKIFHKKRGNENRLRIARWTIGRVYRSLKRYDEALIIMLTLKQEAEEKGDQVGGYTWEELGELTLLMKSQEAAREYFSKAYEALSQDKWLQANEMKRLERLKQLSE